MYDTKYIARKPNVEGYIEYSPEENQIWSELYQQQIAIVPQRACQEYMDGLDILNMPVDRVPQCSDINESLRKASNFSVAHVEAIIPFQEFFTLLANREFPAASFIRTREDFKYIKEPDIFHEYFGHCPMLTVPEYADFTAAYGEFARKVEYKHQVLLARLYWFTVEFGLINTKDGLRIYGGGILSSPDETLYALESPEPQYKPFDALEALRTPYRIDIKQPIYFVLESYQQLYDVLKQDLPQLIQQAIKLGSFAPAYSKD